MNRRGVGNIEFILAFILFASFVAAALYFFNPVKNTSSLTSSADYTINEIIRNTTVNVESYSVKITAPASVDIMAVTIDGVNQNQNARVEDYNGNRLDSRREGNNVIFDRNGKDFVFIRFSEDFERGNFIETASPNSAYYQIASLTTSQLISEKRLKNIKNYYEQDYNSLKTQRDIPIGVDFSFSLEFPDGTSLSTSKTAPIGVEIFSETKIREVLKEDGSSEFGYLTAKIW